MEGIYSQQVQNWLEEFPTASVQYPRELAQVILNEVKFFYLNLKMKYLVNNKIYWRNLFNRERKPQTCSKKTTLFIQLQRHI